jgi:hypothetical protein
MADDPRALAAQAADVMEAALDSEQFSSLPPALLKEYREGIAIARRAADPSTPGADVLEHVEQVLKQFGERQGLWMNDDITRAGQAARMLLDRARRAC